MDASKRFTKILLATDGSEEAQAAVDATIGLSAPSATVKVVHVWNLEIHDRDGRWDLEIRSEAGHLVDNTVDRLLGAGIIAKREICRSDSSHVAAAIAVSAKQFGADIVVVGSRGLSDWQSMLEHSVSHQLLCALDCPVLIVRARAEVATAKARRVVLAIAGGNDLEPGVRAAVAAAESPGSLVMVVHMAQALFGAQGFTYVESDNTIKESLAETIRLLDDAGVEAQGIVARAGSAARALAEKAASWSADLIVTGSSGTRDLGSILLGSVSHELLRATDRPMVIAERVWA